MHIDNEEQMWEFIRDRNPALASGTAKLPADQLERLVGVVWKQAVLSTMRKRPPSPDIPDFMSDLFTGLRGGRKG